MTNQQKRPVVLLITITIILVMVIGAVFSFFAMNDAVVEEFGKPSPNLALTQRVMYPFELFFNRKSLTTGFNLGGEQQVFQVGMGESVSMVCLRLEQQGFIDDAELLRTYLVYTGLDRLLQSGQFKFDPGMSPVQITQEMLDATPKEAVINILAGWRIEEVAANIAASGLSISSEEFIEAAYSPTPVYLSYLPISDIESLEGFLYPGTYVIPRDAGIDVVFETILREFSKQIDQSLLDGFDRQGLSFYDAVILSSIVEKEAVLDQEKPLIASVFYNRLQLGMRLETDPTVQYGLGYQPETGSWWKSPLFIGDLAVDSPYNTYQVVGLPPTPICNPDLTSLRSVALPAETPYFYFRAACDDSGRHNFSITFEEHLNNQCD
jgi:UPF0755 protein